MYVHIHSALRGINSYHLALLYANIKGGADQPANSRILINAILVLFLEIILTLLATRKIVFSS